MLPPTARIVERPYPCDVLGYGWRNLPLTLQLENVSCVTLLLCGVLRFIRKWRLRHRPVADCLEEAGERLFTLTRLPPSQWRSARTTNAIERLHEEFKRRIKTQTMLHVGRYCCDVVLGAARLGADQHAESRWLANARHKPDRSTD
jgi:hypothetical protein